MCAPRHVSSSISATMRRFGAGCSPPTSTRMPTACRWWRPARARRCPSRRLCATWAANFSCQSPPPPPPRRVAELKMSRCRAAFGRRLDVSTSAIEIGRQKSTIVSRVDDSKGRDRLIVDVVARDRRTLVAATILDRRDTSSRGSEAWCQFIVMNKMQVGVKTINYSSARPVFNSSPSIKVNNWSTGTINARGSAF